MMRYKIKRIIKKLCLIMLPEKMLLVAKKFYYPHYLRSISEEEERDVKLLKYLVNEGDHVVDIGANIGVYTKFLSRLVGVSGCVYVIEPVPSTYDILRCNIQKLGLKNVETINCAISDINGEATMEVPLYESGGRNYYRARIIYKNNSNDYCRVRVNIKMIDSLFSKVKNNIAFIKCDVEGHEFECIKGAIDVIKSSKPTWLIEISGDPDVSMCRAYKTFNLLVELGYKAYWFDGEVLRTRRSGETNVNYFFLMPKHLKALETKILIG